LETNLPLTACHTCSAPEFISLIALHGEGYECKITPHWIGQVIRRRLGLKTKRPREGYNISVQEKNKLARFEEQYGVIVQATNAPRSS